MDFIPEKIGSVYVNDVNCSYYNGVV